MVHVKQLFCSVILLGRRLRMKLTSQERGILNVIVLGAGPCRLLARRGIWQFLKGDLWL